MAINIDTTPPADIPTRAASNPFSAETAPNAVLTFGSQLYIADAKSGLAIGSETIYASDRP